MPNIFMKKITLIVLGAVIALMGIAEITGLLNLGTEPVWHAWIKIVIGLIAVIVPFVMEKQINLALYIVSGALIVMGIASLIPGITLATEPMWHSIAKIVIGTVAGYIAMRKK